MNGGLVMKEIKITDTNFSDEVVSSRGLMLLDFWAEWCGPCRMLAPVVHEISEKYPSMKVGKVNIDEEPQLAQMFNIMSIPTLILFSDGKPVKMHTGYAPAEQIEKMWK